MLAYAFQQGFGAGLCILLVVYLVNVLDSAVGFDVVGICHSSDHMAVLVSDFDSVYHVLDAGTVAGCSQIGHIGDGIAMDDRVSPDDVQPVLGIQIDVIAFPGFFPALFHGFLDDFRAGHSIGHKVDGIGQIIGHPAQGQASLAGHRGEDVLHRGF